MSSMRDVASVVTSTEYWKVVVPAVTLFAFIYTLAYLLWGY